MKQILFTIAAVCLSTTVAFAGDDCCGKKKMPTEPVKQAKDDCGSTCDDAKTVKAKDDCGSTCDDAKTVKAKGDCGSKCGDTKTVKAKSDCGSKCGSETVALSKRVATWQAGAAKGCKDSASKLASLKKACKTSSKSHQEQQAQITRRSGS